MSSRGGGTSWPGELLGLALGALIVGSANRLGEKLADRLWPEPTDEEGDPHPEVQG
ncbi:MAG: hypothetical protein AAF851_06310 [Myxococcota bacterium]